MCEHFTQSINIDIFKLVVPIEQKSTLLSLLSRPFLPFEWKLWLTMGMTIMYGSVIYTWVEILGPRWTRQDRRSRKAVRAEGPGGQSSPEPKQLRRDPSAAGTVYYMKLAAGKLLSTFVEALTSSFSASPTFEPKSAGGKAIVVALSFFILVLVATYTAALTAFLAKDEAARFSSVADAVSAGVTICVPEAVSTALLASTPLLMGSVVELPYPEVLQGIDNGKCGAAIYYVDGFLELQNDHCNKEIVGETLLVVDNSFIVREDLLRGFDLEISSLREMGKVDSLINRAKRQYLEPSQCAKDNLDDEDGSIVLGLPEMGGVIIIYASVATAVGVAYLFSGCMRVPWVEGAVDAVKEHANDSFSAISALPSKINNMRAASVTFEGSTSSGPTRQHTASDTGGGGAESDGRDRSRLAPRPRTSQQRLVAAAQALASVRAEDNEQGGSSDGPGSSSSSPDDVPRGPTCV